nr:hypothetical protein [Mycobacterium paragordonae]
MGQGGSGQVQFADHPDGGRVQAGVEDQRAHSGDRGADGDGLSGGQGGGAGGPDGGFGGAVGVEHAPPRRPGGDQLRRAGFGAGDQGVQFGQWGRVQGGQHGGGQDGGVDPLLVQQVGQRVAGVGLGWGHHQGGR